MIVTERLILLPLYDLLKKRLGEAEKYIKEDSKVRNVLKMVGKIKVNVKTNDTNEHVGASIGSDGVEIFRKAIDDPAITISGDSKILTGLVTSPSRAKFDEAQQKEQVKIESHGLKGRLAVSKVKDLLSQG